MNTVYTNAQSINNLYIKNLNNEQINKQKLKQTKIEKEAQLIIDILSNAEYKEAIKKYLIAHGHLILFMPNASVSLSNDNIKKIIDDYKNHEDVLVHMVTQEIENTKYHFLYFQTQYFAQENPHFIDESIAHNEHIETNVLNDIFSIYLPISIYLFPLIDFDHNNMKDRLDVANIRKIEQHSIWFKIKRNFLKTKSVKEIIIGLINHDNSTSYNALYEQFLLNILLLNKNINPWELSKFKSIPPRIGICLPKYAIMNY